MKPGIVLSLFVLMSLPMSQVVTLSGQDDTLSEGEGNYEVDALRCWRRLNTNSPRVGEIFEMWVTCRIVETDVDRVSSDFVSLQAESIEVIPFEVVRGGRSRDIQGAVASFFQFSYSLRISPGNFFGLDLPLPPLEILYRIERRVDEGLFIPGRELRYVIPEEPVHILSLVPEGADSLRPLEGETFNNAGERLLLADSLVFLSIFFGVLAVGLGIAIVVLGLRLGKGQRLEKTVHVSQNVLMFSLFVELRRIRSKVDSSDWNEELVDRALSVTRILSALNGRARIVIRSMEDRQLRHSGEVLVKVGLLRAKKYFVSSSATGVEGIHQSINPRDMKTAFVHFETLKNCLARFTEIRYEKTLKMFPTDLVEVLDEVRDVLLQLARRRFSVMSWGRQSFNYGKRSL